MNKHTPAPWRYYTEPQPNGCPVIGHGNLMVAVVAHSVNERDQHETALANARLIAAAPDLLDELEYLSAVMACHDKTPEEALALEAAKKAIAKAKGENHGN